MKTKLTAFVVIGLAAACAQADEAAPAAEAPAAAETAPAPGTPEAKIAQAMTGGPASISSQAAIMDWPSEEGGQFTELRAGTNGWACFPNTPQASEALQDPMCLDGAWQKWAEAYQGHTQPMIDRVGIAYMLNGDAGASATDPFATDATADNRWVVSGPHLMVIVPDPKILEGYATSPEGGAPWVMWPGTPYAHIMVPIAEGH